MQGPNTEAKNKQKYETGITWRNQETKSQKHKHRETRELNRTGN